MSDLKQPGGYLVGNSHSNGGIKIKTPEGQIEAEGGEVIINKRALSLEDEFVCTGSPKEITSKINEMEGGVSWSETGSCRLVKKAADGTQIDGDEIYRAVEGIAVQYIKSGSLHIITADNKDQAELIYDAINDYREGFITKSELENTLQKYMNDEYMLDLSKVEVIGGVKHIHSDYYDGWIPFYNEEPINADQSTALAADGAEVTRLKMDKIGNDVWNFNYESNGIKASGIIKKNDKTGEFDYLIEDTYDTFSDNDEEMSKNIYSEIDKKFRPYEERLLKAKTGWFVIGKTAGGFTISETKNKLSEMVSEWEDIRREYRFGKYTQDEYVKNKKDLLNRYQPYITQAKEYGLSVSPAILYIPGEKAERGARVSAPEQTIARSYEPEIAGSYRISSKNPNIPTWTGTIQDIIEYIEDSKDVIENYNPADPWDVNLDKMGLTYVPVQAEYEIEEAASGKSILRTSDATKRPSPSVSATIYPEGYRMEGNDGNMWEIAVASNGVHRWKKVAAEDGTSVLPKPGPMTPVMANGGGIGDIELLKNKIRNISKEMTVDGQKGYGGYVVYLTGDRKIQIGKHSDLTPYSSQSGNSTEVSFNAPGKKMVIFSTSVTEPFEDRKSFEKYGGIIYIYEPLTEKIASEIIDKIDTFKKYSNGGGVGDDKIHIELIDKKKNRSEDSEAIFSYSFTKDGKPLVADFEIGFDGEPAEKFSDQFDYGSGRHYTKQEESDYIIYATNWKIQNIWDDGSETTLSPEETKQIEAEFGAIFDEKISGTDIDELKTIILTQEQFNNILSSKNVTKAAQGILVSSCGCAHAANGTELAKISGRKFKNFAAGDEAYEEWLSANEDFLKEKYGEYIQNAEIDGTPDNALMSFETWSRDLYEDVYNLASNGKNVDEKIKVAFYKWGEYEEDQEIDLIDLPDNLLTSEQLEGFSIRPEDEGKFFYASDIDIDDTNVEEEGWGIKRAFATDKPYPPQFKKGGATKQAKPYPLMHLGKVEPRPEDMYNRWHPPIAVYQAANKVWAKADRAKREELLMKYVYDFRNYEKEKIPTPANPKGIGTAVPDMPWRNLTWHWQRDIATGLHNEHFGEVYKPTKIYGNGGMAAGGKKIDGEGEMWFSPTGEGINLEPKGTALHMIENKLAKMMGADSMERVGEDENNYIYTLHGNPMMIAAKTSILEEEKGLDVETWGSQKRVRIPKAILNNEFYVRYPLLTPFADGGGVSAIDSWSDEKVEKIFAYTFDDYNSNLSIAEKRARLKKREEKVRKSFADGGPTKIDDESRGIMNEIVKKLTNNGKLSFLSFSELQDEAKKRGIPEEKINLYINLRLYSGVNELNYADYGTDDTIYPDTGLTANQELNQVQRWLHTSSGGEAFDDWDWDGERLVLFDEDGEVIERYSREELIQSEAFKLADGGDIPDSWDIINDIIEEFSDTSGKYDKSEVKAEAKKKGVSDEDIDAYFSEMKSRKQWDKRYAADGSQVRRAIVFRANNKFANPASVGGFSLVYETWSKIMGGDGTTGTIRTEPQNYYVATVNSDRSLSFDNIEAMTKDIDKQEVKKLWERGEIPKRKRYAGGGNLPEWAERASLTKEDVDWVLGVEMKDAENDVLWLFYDKYQSISEAQNQASKLNSEGFGTDIIERNGNHWLFFKTAFSFGDIEKIAAADGKELGYAGVNKDVVARIMHEFKVGELHDSHGKLVTDRKQAIAIALSMGRRHMAADGYAVEQTIIDLGQMVDEKIYHTYMKLSKQKKSELDETVRKVRRVMRTSEDEEAVKRSKAYRELTEKLGLGNKAANGSGPSRDYTILIGFMKELLNTFNLTSGPAFEKTATRAILLDVVTRDYERLIINIPTLIRETGDQSPEKKIKEIAKKHSVRAVRSDDYLIYRAKNADNGTTVSEEEKQRDMEIATIIINQLGGFGALKMMTGAYNFIALKRGVSFRIKNQKANYIKITLTAMDLYDVEVGRIRGFKYTVVDSANGLYNDQIKGFIEKATGFTLTPPRVIFPKAEDGKMISVPSEEKNRFVDYIYDFYDAEYSKQYVRMAVDEYLRSITKDQWGGGDSVDREKTYKFLRKYPTYDSSLAANGKIISVGDSVHVPVLNRSGVVVKKSNSRPKVYTVKFVDDKTAPFVKDDLELVKEAANGSYIDYIDNLLKQKGFDVSNLSQTQKELILMPTMEPEGYSQDGEISASEAMRNWLYRLSEAGLKGADIKKAVQANFAADGASIDVDSKKRAELIRDMIREAERTMDDDDFMNILVDYSANEDSSEMLQWWVIDSMINELRYSDKIEEFISRAKALGWTDQYAADGRPIGEQNAEMVKSQNNQIQHHAKELDSVLSRKEEVPAWVLSKTTRAATDMSDVAHYLEGLKAADGKYLDKAGDNIVRLQEYIVNHGGFITIHGSNYGYYSHGAYNLRVVGTRGAIYNIIPYFPTSSTGNLQNAKFFSLIRAKKATNFAITDEGQLIDIVESGIFIGSRSFMYDYAPGVKWKVEYEWDRDYPIILGVKQDDVEIELDTISEADMDKISDAAYQDRIETAIEQAEYRREDFFSDGGAATASAASPKSNDNRPKSATPMKIITFTKKVNPRIKIVVKCYPNMSIFEIENEHNIRFPYVVGQVLNMGHKNWACVNGWLINDEDPCPEKKVMGIRVSDVPEGHPLRHLYPGKFRANGGGVKSIHDYSVIAYKDGQRATYFVDKLDGSYKIIRHTGSVTMPFGGNADNWKDWFKANVDNFDVQGAGSDLDKVKAIASEAFGNGYEIAEVTSNKPFLAALVLPYDSVYTKIYSFGRATNDWTPKMSSFMKKLNPGYKIEEIEHDWNAIQQKDIKGTLTVFIEKDLKSIEYERGGPILELTGISISQLEKMILDKINQKGGGQIKARIITTDNPEGKIKRYAKSQGGTGVLEMMHGKKRYGRMLSSVVNPSRLVSIQFYDEPKEKSYADELKLAQKYIQANRHPNLWDNLAKEYEFSEEKLEQFKRDTSGLSHYDAWSKADSYGLPRIEQHKTITMQSAGMPEYAQEQLKDAIENKRDYSYHWDCGYDCSVSTKMGTDGIYRGWFSQEYRGTGNGHYWLLISPTQAIFAEHD